MSGLWFHYKTNYYKLVYKNVTCNRSKIYFVESVENTYKLNKYFHLKRRRFCTMQISVNTPMAVYQNESLNRKSKMRELTIHNHNSKKL